MRQDIGRIADKLEYWAGIPIPHPDFRMRLEPRWPRRDEFMTVLNETENEEPQDVKVRNVFWSWRHRSDVVIYEQDGKITWGIVPGVHAARMVIHTVGASVVWTIEQEKAAMALLADLVSPYVFKTYFLTGSFAEISKRSGVTYLFRRLRPTVATRDGKILCALCMHPIAYYEGSWAGGMCPTDDVIAHLMLMRGDEHMFWKRSNQHAPYRAACGL